MSTTCFPAADKAECSNDGGEDERCQTDGKNSAVKTVESHAFQVVFEDVGELQERLTRKCFELLSRLMGRLGEGEMNNKPVLRHGGVLLLLRGVDWWLAWWFG